MNYYIKGDAANADQIKAAFKEKGYRDQGWIFSSKHDLYFSVGTLVYAIPYKIRHIITERPDYKELELPVEPKFKVGDTISWIGHDCDTQKIVDIRKGSYITVDKYDVRCALKFTKQDEWELVPNPKPHYDIANFQPFDKVLVRCADDEEWAIEMFSKYYDSEPTIHGRTYRFMCIADSYSQCIPFNDGTKHLLGTTGMPDERFINW